MVAPEPNEFESHILDDDTCAFVIRSMTQALKLCEEYLEEPAEGDDGILEMIREMGIDQGKMVVILYHESEEPGQLLASPDDDGLIVWGVAACEQRPHSPLVLASMLLSDEEVRFIRDDCSVERARDELLKMGVDPSRPETIRDYVLTHKLH